MSNDELEKLRDADMAIIRKSAEDLGEHFDSARIFVTRHINGEDGTTRAGWGVGNWFGSFGIILEWMKGPLTADPLPNEDRVRLSELAQRLITTYQFESAQIFVTRCNIPDGVTQGGVHIAGNRYAAAGQLAQWVNITNVDDAAPFIDGSS